MGARSRSRSPADGSAMGAGSRSRSIRAPAVGPSISSVVPSRAGFLGSAALPICSGNRSRERDWGGENDPPPLPNGGRWGRDQASAWPCACRFSGGFFMIYRRFALWIGFGRYVGGGFVLSYLCFALGVGLGRYVWQWFVLGVGFGRYPKSQKALESPHWLSWVGSMAIDLLENYLLERERPAGPPVAAATLRGTLGAPL